MVSEHSPSLRIMAGDEGGGKEARGSQIKKVESLETELGHLYARMENQRHQIQQNTESMASLQLKMDQKFEEALSAIAKSRPEEPNGKKSVVSTPEVETRKREMILKGGTTNRRFHKHEIPLFDGTNTHEWIFNVEGSFCSYEDEETMKAVERSLEGEALLFYEWEHRRRPIRDWEELKGLIQWRFKSSNDAAEQILTDSQFGSLVDSDHDSSKSQFRPPLSSLPLFRELEARNRGKRDPILHQKGVVGDRWNLVAYSQATTVTKHRPSMTTPLNEVTEEGYLSHRRNGLESKEWVEFGKLGLHSWDQTIKADKKLGPNEIKMTVTQEVL
ncbi:unnamed protein product [Lactuca virosa]|uniref:Uncharacterized protein n=1 Tax=Lactuca virosa TaxID=75947 RepID=A0AAU9P827_9ASTR|nr:unnamed protein product [Lactuca virosa]